MKPKSSKKVIKKAAKMPKQKVVAKKSKIPLKKDNKLKIKFGIPGLDSMIKGGLSAGKSILLSGSPGTGKSIAAMQFLVYGANNSEPGLYIATEENAASLIDDAKILGWDIEAFIKKGLITIYEPLMNDSKLFSLDEPLSIIKKKSIKRVVLDSITLFKYLYDGDEKVVRKGIVDFNIKMKEMGVSYLGTIERRQSSFQNGMSFSSEEFLFDGLIILDRIRRGASYERVLNLAKLRGHEHPIDVFPITLGKGGMKVQIKQYPFSLVEDKKGFQK